MNVEFYNQLADESIRGHVPDQSTCRNILTSPEIELLPLLNAAYAVRRAFTGKEVTVHIINNSQNGSCALPMMDAISHSSRR